MALIKRDMNGTTNLIVMDTLARSALGSACSGVSTGPIWWGIEVISPSQINQDLALSVLDNYGSLTVETNKASVSNNGLDTATITHSTAKNAVNSIVFHNGELYSTGQHVVVAGIVTLLFSETEVGTYDIHLLNTDGIGSGSVRILVTES